MTIYFLVPSTGCKANGGIRIIYEHANRLQERGHDVCLWHIAQFPTDRWRSFPRRIYNYLREGHDRPNFPGWFKINEGVRREYRFDACIPDIQPSDKLVATYFKTHDIIPEEVLIKRDCYYLIQALETLYAPLDHLQRQWKSPSKNIAIARWLEDLVEDVAGHCDFVPNAFNFDFFKQEGVKEYPQKPVILFYSMLDPTKGSATSVDGLNLLHERGVDFDLVSFGNQNPAALGLRRPCEHHHRPTQEALRKLYRRSSIFLSSSTTEGWGLTIGEATACGAALVVSDAEGHFEFAQPESSALFFQRGNAEQLADLLAKLAADPAWQRELVRNAQADLAPFTWERAVDEMEKALQIDTKRK